MKLSDLFSLRRYRECRAIFRSPLAAHLCLSRARSNPARLHLIDGEVLALPNVREAREMFTWICGGNHSWRIDNIHDDLVELDNGEYRVALPVSGESFFAFSEVFLTDVYRLAKIQRPLGTVVDLGANIGLFASRVAPIANRVICVEPIVDNLEIAKSNVHRTEFGDKVSFHHLAIAGRSGQTAKIYLSRSNRGGHSISAEHVHWWGENGHQEVATISLADLFEQEAIEECSLLKCDIEGAEFDVIANSPPEILARIEQIVMEVHLTTAEWGMDALQQLVENLSSAGFRIEHEPVPEFAEGQMPVIMLYAQRK